MNPTRDKLPKLHNLDIVAYADWLYTGIEGYLNNEGRQAFIGAEPYVGWNYIADDLAAIHDVLTPTEQRAFRFGIMYALNHITNDDIAKILLELGEQVGIPMTMGISGILCHPMLQQHGPNQ